MKQLEIKHLAPYLPYGLNVCINGVIQKMNSLDSEAKLVCYGWGNAGFLHKDDVKPILRPLSDLTKEIEHNGERFVPIDWIRENLDYDEYLIDYYLNHTERLPYEIIGKLLEWHFDVFGLINKKLAIDINTLEI